MLAPAAPPFQLVSRAYSAFCEAREDAGAGRPDYP